MKKHEEIPKQPEGFFKNIIWFASYRTERFIIILVTVVLCIIALSIEYRGKTIKKDSIDVMEKVEKMNERKN